MVLSCFGEIQQFLAQRPDWDISSADTLTGTTVFLMAWMVQQSVFGSDIFQSAKAGWVCGSEEDPGR